MHIPPPRRHYAQMVRVVRNEQQGLYKNPVPYVLGKAYGTESTGPADTRIRSLDELGINSRPPNQLQAPSLTSNYTVREATALYAQLPREQQHYFEGINPNPAPTRQDAKPGTKTRVYLGSHATAETIDVAPSELTASTASSNSQRQANTAPAPAPAPKTHPAPAYQHPLPAKQTLLPVVKAPALQGTVATALSFSLK
ncbi:MAG: hypothetical protein KTR20_04045 [Cellvibrionaceae bacterium]|nr:hypothetical protein [Cellvibrionaceae bacterium]